MCLVFGLFALLWSIYFTIVAGDATFISPPPYPKSGFNLATSPSYELGSEIDIKWTIQPRSNVSLMLFQLNGTTSLSRYEKIFSDLDADVTSFRWTVQTKKDLAFSNHFWMCLFPENENIAAACTAFFNITGFGAGVEAPVPVSTSAGSDTRATRSHTSLPATAAPATRTADGSVPVPITTSESIILPIYFTSTSSTSTLATTSPNTPTSTSTPENSGLSTATKAGIGVGLAGAIVTGAGLVLAFIRWKKWRETPVETNSITRLRIFGAFNSSISSYHDNRSRSTDTPVFVSG